MNIPRRTLKRVHRKATVAREMIEQFVSTLNRAQGLSVIVILDLLANSQNKAMAIDCLMSLMHLHNKSQTQIAEEHGVSRQATHILFRRLEKVLGLPPLGRATTVKITRQGVYYDEV